MTLIYRSVQLRSRRFICAIAKLVAMLAIFFCANTAFAQKEITLTIQQIKALDCFDEIGLICGSEADFYSKVKIANGNFSTPVTLDDDDITPNKKFRNMVNADTVDIVIEVWDEDDINADDHADLTPSGGRDLRISLDLTNCTISGDATGNCGTTIVSSGTDDDNAEIKFRIDITDIRLGEVEVVIERITALDCVDDVGCLSEADFYAEVGIDAFFRNNYVQALTFENQDDIAPYWVFRRFINMVRPVIPIDIKIIDADDINDDDTVDVKPGPGRILHLELITSSCDIQGDATGTCGDILNVASRIKREGNQSTMARIQFRIQRYIEPRLRLQCLHSPIWPQPGKPATIQANFFTADNEPLKADQLQVNLGLTSFCNDATTCELNISSFSTAAIYNYECSAEYWGKQVTSGIRQFTVGSPSPDKAVAIWTQRPKPEALDLVFIADKDSYNGSNDPAFLQHVHKFLQEGYMNEEIYLRNQDRFNFWISKDMGDAIGFKEGSPCVELPPDYAVNIPFSDTNIALHTDAFRDCAQNNSFSIENFSLDTLLHESGHRPFGLKDEYCCDGGYFQTAVNPNMYGPETSGTTVFDACMLDPLAKLPNSCKEFTSKKGEKWYRLDHAPAFSDDEDLVENDLMLDNQVMRAADERRIQGVIDALP